MKFLLSLITVVVLAESCKSTKEKATTEVITERKTMEQTDISNTYIISEIKGVSDISETLTITFDEASKKVSGFSGCNTYMGTYKTNGDMIDLGTLASTKKFCKEDKDRIERHFLDILSKVNTFKIEEQTISLFNKTEKLISASVKVAKKPSKSDIVKDNYIKTVITYKASSRGSFEYIQVTKNDIITTNDRNLKNMSSYSCKSEDWKALQGLVNAIDIKSIDKLKAPTDKRLFDGAAHATLSIIQGDVLMTTPSFDHGAPPKEIEALVNKVLSIGENATKQ